MSHQVRNGKAFEFAISRQIGKITETKIVDNSALNKASHYYHSINDTALLDRIDRAADELAVFLQYHDKRLDNAASIRLQPDNKGTIGDVRDIVIEINDDEVGISAKHNHDAIKHPRLSDTIDFGKQWGACPVSNQYWKAVKPIFEDMRNNKGHLFRDVRNKQDIYYLPILAAFEDELRRICEDYPRQFIWHFFQYLIGTKDHYKAICEKDRVLVSSVNLHGTLEWGKKWKMPERIEHIRRKSLTKSTLIVTFEGGWQLSFRLHNASSKIQPSLKFDIQFIGMSKNVAKHEIILV